MPQDVRAMAAAVVPVARLKESASAARAAYRRHIFQQTANSLRGLPEYSTDESALLKKAREGTDGSLAKALQYWFGKDAKQYFDQWCAKQPPLGEKASVGGAGSANSVEVELGEEGGDES
jgi:hypothetical protein